MRARVLVLLAIIAVCFADEAIVHTDLGDVRGLVFQTHRAFLGIPFIQPPINDLRFAAPVPAASWEPSTLEATKFKPGCPQHCHLPPGACPDEQSEDCIYLNIYTPLKPRSDKLPVIAWFPGGHFEQGSAGSILYDGAYLVTNQSQVILVAINYR
jgi:carboxylesterase type B